MGCLDGSARSVSPAAAAARRAHTPVRNSKLEPSAAGRSRSASPAPTVCTPVRRGASPSRPAAASPRDAFSQNRIRLVGSPLCNTSPPLSPHTGGTAGPMSSRSGAGTGTPRAGGTGTPSQPSVSSRLAASPRGATVASGAIRRSGSASSRLHGNTGCTNPSASAGRGGPSSAVQPRSSSRCAAARRAPGWGADSAISTAKTPTRSPTSPRQEKRSIRQSSRDPVASQEASDLASSTDAEFQRKVDEIRRELMEFRVLGSEALWVDEPPSLEENRNVHKKQLLGPCDQRSSNQATCRTHAKAQPAWACVPARAPSNDSRCVVEHDMPRTRRSGTRSGRQPAPWPGSNHAEGPKARDAANAATATGGVVVFAPAGHRLDRTCNGQRMPADAGRRTSGIR